MGLHPAVSISHGMAESLSIHEQLYLKLSNQNLIYH